MRACHITSHHGVRLQVEQRVPVHHAPPNLPQRQRGHARLAGLRQEHQGVHVRRIPLRAPHQLPVLVVPVHQHVQGGAQQGGGVVLADALLQGGQLVTAPLPAGEGGRRGEGCRV